MFEKEVQYAISTGHINYEMANKLEAQVKRIVKNYKIYKIGITGVIPIERFRKYPSTYKKMIVIYKSKSETYVKILEKYLVDRTWKTNKNKVGGGGGGLSNKTPIYYLYVVVG
jgi:hypothetical protein